MYLTTSNGSATLTVNKVAHQLQAGDLFTFSGMTIPGSGTGFVDVDFTTNTFEVQSATADTYQTMAIMNQFGLTAGGATTVNPYVKPGPVDATPALVGVAQWGGQTLALTKMI